MTTFTGLDGVYEHRVGDRDCPEDWPGYPKPCEEDGCDGLVHGEFGDENSDGDYWLWTQCDKCGQSE